MPLALSSEILMSENKQQSERCIAIKEKSQGRAVMHLRRGGIFITLQSHSTAGHLLRTFLSSQYLCSSTSDAFGNYVLCKLIFYVTLHDTLTAETATKRIFKISQHLTKAKL